MSKAVLSEIARLEGELARIQRELEALRLRVDGTGRKTQALAAFKTQPPPDIVRGDVRGAPADETAMTLPPPPVSRDSKSHATMASPAPSSGSVSEVVAVDGKRKNESGRNEAGRVGLSSPPPPHSNTTPSRRNAAVDPDAGRYVNVGEGRSPRRR